MQAINPINTHTKFGKDRINTFPLNERKSSVWTPDGGKSKNNMSTPQWGGHNSSLPNLYFHGAVFKQEGQRCPKRRVAQAAIRLATAVITFRNKERNVRLPS